MLVLLPFILQYLHNEAYHYISVDTFCTLKLREFLLNHVLSVVIKAFT